MQVSKCWKIAEFPKALIKMKNCKRFYEIKTATRLVHKCRFENLPLSSCSSINNTLKISHSLSWELSSYLRMKFAHFLKSGLCFNILYCFRVFVNKHFTYLTCAYFKTHILNSFEILGISFSCEEEDIVRF